MEIRELDKVLRTAIEVGSIQPKLASLAGSGHVVRLPGEFAFAMNSYGPNHQWRFTSALSGNT